MFDQVAINLLDMQPRTGVSFVCYPSWWEIEFKNPCDNAVRQLVLQLREIVELICAPAITTDQVILKYIISLTRITSTFEGSAFLISP